MLETELALFLHRFGTYLMVALIIILTWVISEVNTHNRIKDTLLSRAESAARARIHSLEWQLKQTKEQLKTTQAELEAERTTRRAVAATIQRALKINTEGK